jgi:antitoxin YefM
VRPALLLLRRYGTCQAGPRRRAQTDDWLLAAGRSPADGTLVSMAVEPLDEVRNHLSDVIGRVELRRERVTVTRDGRAVAVILSPEDLAELEESLAVLSDPQALADIREADAAYATGDVLRCVDAVRTLRS